MDFHGKDRRALLCLGAVFLFLLLFCYVGLIYLPARNADYSPPKIVAAKVDKESGAEVPLWPDNVALAQQIGRAHV